MVGRSSTLNHRLGMSFSVVAMLLWAALSSSATAELSPARKQVRDRHVTNAVMELLNKRHLLRRPLDDEISRRTLGSFLKQLDPMKVYFYQSDIDEFSKSNTELDDQVRVGDIAFAYTVFNRFLQRMEERMSLIPELLEIEHDFSLDEDLVTDPDVATYAKSPEEAADRWRKRIKFDLLMLKDKSEEKEEDKGKEESFPPLDIQRPPNSSTVGEGKKARTEEEAEEDAVERLKRRYSSLLKRMKQYKADDLLEIYLSALTTSYDPHTTYMSPTTLENFNIQMKLNLEGIGAALSILDGYTVVSRVITGGAADKQGELKPEDRITSVGQGTSGDMVDVIDMRLNDVVQLIRGKAGTIVRLGVVTDGESKTVKIVRDRIELKDSEARGEIVSSESFAGVRKANGALYRVGVIRLPSFYMDMDAARRRLANFKSTTRDVRRILSDFKREGIDAVVLDLRFNGGGSLTEAINLTGLFIDTGPVVQVKDPTDSVRAYNDDEPGTSWDGPLAVVTNKFSASASEILAGAVQDYKRGIIIGDRTTHGKGTVQSLLNLSQLLFEGIPNPPNFGALKITMQQFYRPNGDSTQKRGVVVDVPLPSTTNEMDIGEADLDYAVQFDTVPLASHVTYPHVRPDIVSRLNARLQTRLGESEEFGKEIRRIERYKEQRERDYVSLNEEEFFARRKELNAEKEDEETFKEIDNGNDIVIDLNDFYDKEIVAITLDYVTLLKN